MTGVSITDEHCSYIGLVLDKNIDAINEIRGENGFGHLIRVEDHIYYVTYTPHDANSGKLTYKRFAEKMTLERAMALPSSVLAHHTPVDIEFTVAYKRNQLNT